MKKLFFISAMLLLLPFGKAGMGFSFAQSSAVPFTLEDRDRIIQMQIKMDERFESLQKEMNTRFESQQQQITDLKESISDLRSSLRWNFGILFTFMIFLFGFIIWDRKTVTEPIREHTQSLIQTLREYAKEQPKLADILRSHGLL